MGYCGIIIPGNTGTDFKHKKVFTHSKKLLNYKSKIANVRIESREEYKYNYWYSGFKIAIVVAFSIIVLLLISFMATRIDNTAINKTYLSSEYFKSIKAIEKKEAAVMLYNSAKLYFESGGLNYAQDEITLVLKLYPTNDEALKLMHKILDKQCEVKNIFCKEANEYKAYLDLYSDV